MEQGIWARCICTSAIKYLLYLFKGTNMREFSDNLVI